MERSSRLSIKAERLNQGLSLRDAAALIGVHEDTLRAAERGRVVQARLAKRIADFYGVRVTDIWPIEDEAA